MNTVSPRTLGGCVALCLALFACATAVDAPSATAPTMSNDQLAKAFRPLLFFDRNEHWRPLRVDSVLRSGQIHVCTKKRDCVAVHSGADLPTRGGYLDIAGTPFLLSSYHSVNARCVHKVVYDCDQDSTAPLYYHISRHGGYRYIDYWAYYRFNDAPSRTLDEHESDWEGLSVVVPSSDPAPTHFAFVQFAAHKGVYRYLPDVLQCESTPVPCTDESARVDDYVARGTHASYPRACVHFCHQEALPWVEYAFGGQSPWGGNANGQVVPLTSEAWSSWNGYWDPRKGVKSPGNQPRYKAPWSARCSTRWSKLPASICNPDNPCASWFGPGVVAGACDPTALSRSLASGTLNTGTTIRLSSSDTSDASGRAAGISQITGTPLQPTQSITIAGGANPRERLIVAAENDDYSALASFDSLGLEFTHAAKLEVAANAHGPVSIKIIPQGTFLQAPKPIRPATLTLIPK